MKVCLRGIGHEKDGNLNGCNACLPLKHKIPSYLDRATSVVHDCIVNFHEYLVFHAIKREKLKWRKSHEKQLTFISEPPRV